MEMRANQSTIQIELSIDFLVILAILIAAFATLLILFTIRDPSQLRESAVRNVERQKLLEKQLADWTRAMDPMAQPSELDLSFIKKKPHLGTAKETGPKETDQATAKESEPKETDQATVKETAQ